MTTGTTAPAAYDATVSPPAAGAAATGISRLRSIDLMRGVIMVLMAIDHVRVYSGLPAGGPTAGIFFTRWVTHFCAPGFVFFAGTAAFLYGHKVGDTRALSRFLLSRGVLLVVLEVTLIRATWTFGVDYSTFVLAGVIWMLGWCMVLLAAMVRLSPKVIGWAGVAIVALQQLFALVPRALPEGTAAAFARIWEFVYPAGFDALAPFAVLYVLVPWVGVMMAGYGFGALLTLDEPARRRLCLRIGIGATAAFLILASVQAMQQGDGRPFAFRLLDQQKYPASQLYLLMTLGPMIALLPVAGRVRGWFADALVTVGRVPLFYYLLHIPLIHASALVVNYIRTGAPHGEWYATAPFTAMPQDQWWSLALLYLVFAFDVAVLYVACRWYARTKAERPAGWMRYI